MELVVDNKYKSFVVLKKTLM